MKDSLRESKLHISKTGADFVSLAWDTPSLEDDVFEISYWPMDELMTNTSQDFKITMTVNGANSVTVRNLKRRTKYAFAVCTRV